MRVKCECQNPGCSEHSEKYKCKNKAIGTLSDGDSNPMEYCSGCAADTMTGIEFENGIVWELFYEWKAIDVADENLMRIFIEDTLQLRIGSAGGDRSKLENDGENS